MLELPLAAAELGGYINGFKLLPFAIISLIWLKLMTWADKDAENARLPRENTNLIHLGLWAVGLLLALFLPNIFVSAAVFAVLFAIDIGVYLSWRSKTVGLKDLSQQFADWKANLGKKEFKVVANENNVVLVDRGGKPFQPPADDAAEKPGYDAIQTVLQHPMRVGASRIDVRPADGGGVVRYTVDGVPFEGKTLPADQAASAIELMKLLANLDIAEKRRPQSGKMKLQTEKAKHDIDISTAGSKSGEQMKLMVDFKKSFDFRVNTIGLLPDQEQQVMETVQDAGGGGVVLLTAPEGQGQTNLAYAILKQHDAFLSNIQTLERDPPFELEGITQNKLAANAGAGEESKQISWMISQEPDVIFIDRCDDPASAIALSKYSLDGRRVYIAMRAANTFDALAQWRKLVGDDSDAIKAVRLVIAERLIRKLCEACNIPYKPEPEALKKMNMSPDRVQTLHQARKEPMRDQKGNEIICGFCHGMAYKGRTGVFELFRVDDDVRSAITDGGNVNQYKQLFRKQKQRYLQEAALKRVEEGQTSVEEVLRVLRGPSSR